MHGTQNYFGQRNGTMAGREYVTLDPIEKNTQLAHWYGDGWWSIREIKRQDQGTKRFPLPVRLPHLQLPPHLHHRWSGCGRVRQWSGFKTA